jgi:hypothetical protein
MQAKERHAAQMAAFKTLSGAVKILRSIGACRMAGLILSTISIWVRESYISRAGASVSIGSPVLRAPGCQLLIIFKMADAVPSR